MLFVNKQAIALAFGRAAQSYVRYNELQQRSVQGLLKLLKKRHFNNVLDAGCGPGDNSLFWRKTGSRVIALDLSKLMLKQARKNEVADGYLVADIEEMPLIDSQFDLVWSHLAIQWCDDLSKALSELYRVARPGGFVAFTTIVKNSLSELTQAWRAIDMQPHTNRFLSPEEVKKASALWHLRYCEQSITIYFDNALSAMRSLKGVGATHIRYRQTPTRMLTRRELQGLERAWPHQEMRYPLTYQLFHGVIKRD